MATAIQNPAELQELIDLCEANGIYVPGDIKTVEELIRSLLVAHKTKAAALAMQKEREDRQRLAKQSQRFGNPDRPRGRGAAKRLLLTGQFSTESDPTAKEIVDAQEAHYRRPNVVPDPFAHERVM